MVELFSFTLPITSFEVGDILGVIEFFVFAQIVMYFVWSYFLMREEGEPGDGAIKL